MTAPVEPIPIEPGPAVPSSAAPEATFDALYEAFNAWEKNELQPGANALAAATYTNALAASEQAVAAGASADTAAGAAIAALGAADAAATTAAELASLDALWLGAAASDPATGKEGTPLVPGNAYVNTATGYLRAYNGTEWVQGISSVSGVSSVNGQVGAVTVQPDLFFVTQGIF